MEEHSELSGIINEKFVRIQAALDEFTDQLATELREVQESVDKLECQNSKELRFVKARLRNMIQAVEVWVSDTGD